MLSPVSFDNLRLFRDIAQSKSFSRGASMNKVSQSAASQHVQEMEKTLGVPLLDRSTRPLAVTDAGQLYLAFCRDVLRRKEEFEASFEQIKHEVEGTVRVASIYSVGLNEMVQLEQEFARRQPSARLEVEYLRPEKVYASVLADDADLGLVSYPEPSREIMVIPWRREEMVLAASPYHPLAAKSLIEPADLNGVDFIGFDEELPIRREVDRFFREQQIEVNQMFHFDNLQMIKEAVAHRVGVSIMPARAMLEEMGQGRLVAIPIGAQELYRPLGIIHRRKKRFQRVAQAFLDLLCEQPSTDLGLV
ncbi:MAG TPA: LysR family transcriptional regulator [Bryobacteraceae bacterium]|nr:LysR family transcriptional regulator [Bryobacteraceae bacterium]